MPSYLQDILSFRGPGYNIRNSEIRLNLPKPNLVPRARDLQEKNRELWDNP